MKFLIAVSLALFALAPGSPRTSDTISPTYISPKPSSKLLSPGTTIAVRFPTELKADALKPDSFAVTGSKSGRGAGRVILADDKHTALFAPQRPFTPGETVSVTLASAPTAAGDMTTDVRFQFETSPKPYPYITKGRDVPPSAPVKTASRYVTAPASLPVITMTRQLGSSADGYTFLATFNSPFPYLLILDRSGDLVFYRQMREGRQYVQFMPQPDGRLTYFDGIGTNWGGFGSFYVMDSSYNAVDKWDAGNGYETDNHDLRLLPNGGALLMSYVLQPVDMTAYGGKRNAEMLDTIVQELDANRNVVFQWRASDTIPLTDSYEDLTGDLVDYVHGNSIALHPDGDLLVSLRNTSEVVKINRETGEIVWRLGGKHSDFEFIDDGGFSYQHDARWLPDDHLLLFDNGNKHENKFSRAVEYAIDEVDKTVTKVWEYRHQPDIFGQFMGNAQRLPNGNTLIGWGGPQTVASEVTPDGKRILDLEIGAPGGFVYQWLKYPWQGKPSQPPVLAINTASSTPSLNYSWNGATDVAAYRIEAGKSATSFTPVLTETRQGFETVTPVTGDLLKACAYRVMPIDQQGKDTRYSNTVQRKGQGCP
jgi:hypothetical protein